MIIDRGSSPFKAGDLLQAEFSIPAEPSSSIYEDKKNIEVKKMHTTGRHKSGSSDNQVKHILDLVKDFDAETEHLIQETNVTNRSIRRKVCTIKEIEKDLDAACSALGWNNPRSAIQVSRIGQVSSEAAWTGKWHCLTREQLGIGEPLRETEELLSVGPSHSPGGGETIDNIGRLIPRGLDMGLRDTNPQLASPGRRIVGKEDAEVAFHQSGDASEDAKDGGTLEAKSDEEEKSRCLMLILSNIATLTEKELWESLTYDDGEVRGNIFDEKKFGSLVIGVNFIRDEEDSATGKARISFHDYRVLHRCRIAWNGMTVKDAMGRANVIKVEVMKWELGLPTSPIPGGSVRRGKDAFCIPKQHHDKDLEEALLWAID